MTAANWYIDITRRGNYKKWFHTDVSRFHGLVTQVVHGRRLITTDAGLIGLGPPLAESGDIVCVLLGAPIPSSCVRMLKAGILLLANATWMVSWTGKLLIVSQIRYRTWFTQDVLRSENSINCRTYCGYSPLYSLPRVMERTIVCIWQLSWTKHRIKCFGCPCLCSRLYLQEL